MPDPFAMTRASERRALTPSEMLSAGRAFDKQQAALVVEEPADKPAENESGGTSPPDEKVTIHRLVEILANCTNPLTRERAVALAKEYGLTWNQVRYAAGLNHQHRKQGKYDSDGPLLAFKRLRGGRRNETWVWGPAKWKTSRLLTAPTFRTCRDCRAQHPSTVKFRAALCQACYFKRRRATVGKGNAATLGRES